MAKSIDEIAKIECCNDVDIAYFKYGANAVLEEIESCYDKDDSLCVIAHKIQSKIIELKGGITMATIKMCTNIPQSKVLAKILPHESADMYYREWKRDTKDIRIAHVGTAGKEDLQCWSLSALLSVLPNNENISTNLSKGGYRISTLEYTNSWFVDYEDETNGLNNCVTSADNPVDACVEMIKKLHELNLL